jgi:hypothetical protein
MKEKKLTPKRDLTLEALKSGVFALRQSSELHKGLDDPKSKAIGKLADAMQIRINKIVISRRSRLRSKNFEVT